MRILSNASIALHYLPLSALLAIMSSGCMASSDESDVPAELQDDIADFEVSVPQAVSGCTVSATKPTTGNRVYSDGVTRWSVIGQASVSGCTVATTITVKATLRNETTGRNGYWPTTCYNAKSCWVEVFLTHSSGRWYTEGESSQASPSYAKSTWSDL
jgi:hypothetical protein